MEIIDSCLRVFYLFKFTPHEDMDILFMIKLALQLPLEHKTTSMVEKNRKLIWNTLFVKIEKNYPQFL